MIIIYLIVAVACFIGFMPLCKYMCLRKSPPTYIVTYDINKDKFTRDKWGWKYTFRLERLNWWGDAIIIQESNPVHIIMAVEDLEKEGCDVIKPDFLKNNINEKI